MKKWMRIIILSLLVSEFHQPISASINKNNVEEEEENRGRASLSLEHSIIPTGSVISFAGRAAPPGWLLCDGQQYSSQQYPHLYSVVGEDYIPQGSWIHQANNHARLEKFFCVPDMRGRTSVGVDSNASRVTENNTIGASGGEEKHQLTVNELAKHTHSLNLCSGRNSQHSIMNDYGGTYCDDGSLQPAGGDQPHNNMQPYLILNYIIKY